MCVCVACDCKIRYKCVHIRPANLTAYSIGIGIVRCQSEENVKIVCCDSIMIETSSRAIHEHKDSPMEKRNKCIRFRLGGSFTAIRHLIVSFGFRTQLAPTTLSSGNATRKLSIWHRKLFMNLQLFCLSGREKLRLASELVGSNVWLTRRFYRDAHFKRKTRRRMQFPCHRNHLCVRNFRSEIQQGARTQSRSQWATHRRAGGILATNSCGH